MESLSEHFEALLTAAGVIISGLIAILGWFARGEIMGLKRRQDAADTAYKEFSEKMQVQQKQISDVQLQTAQLISDIIDRLSHLEGAHSAQVGSDWSHIKKTDLAKLIKD